MPEQELWLLLENDVINGFSYSFSKALLEKLKALKEEDRIFKDGWEQAEDRTSTSRLTDIAVLCTHFLLTQLDYNTEGRIKSYRPFEIKQVILLAEEFLAIFEEEQTG